MTGAGHQLDPEALGDHIDRLYRAAWSLCGSREEAEDLVQETFAKVLLKPRLVRNDDVGLTVMAAVIGLGAGAAVALVQALLGEMRHELFNVSFETHLSAAIGIEKWRIIAVPAIGGLVYGLVAWLMRRWKAISPAL